MRGTPLRADPGGTSPHSRRPLEPSWESGGLWRIIERVPPVTTRPRGPKGIIEKHDLGEDVLKMKDEGASAEEIRHRLNMILEAKGSDDRITDRRTIVRFMVKIPSTALAHRADIAEKGVVRTVNVMDKTVTMIERLEGWVVEAERQGMGLDADGNPLTDEDGEPITPEPNWYARLGTTRELRNQLQFYADIMERLWNAEQIQQFQETVMSVIADVDPEVAAEIRKRLQEREAIRRSILAPRAA